MNFQNVALFVMKMKLIVLWIATIKFVSLVILKLTSVPFVAEVYFFCLEKSLFNPIMEKYHRMNDIDLGFTDNDTFANFLFYHEYWGASEMFKHKANLTRMEWYNP